MSTYTNTHSTYQHIILEVSILWTVSLLLWMSECCWSVP